MLMTPTTEVLSQQRTISGSADRHLLGKLEGAGDDVVEIASSTDARRRDLFAGSLACYCTSTFPRNRQRSEPSHPASLKPIVEGARYRRAQRGGRRYRTQGRGPRTEGRHRGRRRRWTGHGPGRGAIPGRLTAPCVSLVGRTRAVLDSATADLSPAWQSPTPRQSQQSPFAITLCVQPTPRSPRAMVADRCPTSSRLLAPPEQIMVNVVSPGGHSPCTRRSASAWGARARRALGAASARLRLMDSAIDKHFRVPSPPRRSPCRPSALPTVGSVVPGPYPVRRGTRSLSPWLRRKPRACERRRRLDLT